MPIDKFGIEITNGDIVIMDNQCYMVITCEEDRADIRLINASGGETEVYPTHVVKYDRPSEVFNNTRKELQEIRDTFARKLKISDLKVGHAYMNRHGIYIYAGKGEMTLYVCIASVEGCTGWHCNNRRQNCKYITTKEKKGHIFLQAGWAQQENITSLQNFECVRSKTLYKDVSKVDDHLHLLRQKVNERKNREERYRNTWYEIRLDGQKFADF